MFDFPLNPIDYLHRLKMHLTAMFFLKRSFRSGRTGRANKHGRVTSLIAKRDYVLSKAIQVNFYLES